MSGNQRIPVWRSLKTRVTLVALAVFVLGVWSVALYASRMLHRDLQRLLSEQQLSTVTILAKQVNEEFVLRLRAVGLLADRITTDQMVNPRKLLTILESSPLIQEMFNAGMFIVGAEGTAIASIPTSRGWDGVNFSERDYIVTALKLGRSSVSEPVMGKGMNAPAFAIAAPIHDSKGHVIGVLSGVVNLSQPNFLDLIIGQHYGKSGNYLLVDPRHDIVVTATDKRLNLKPLRTVGINPVTDRYAAGFEGTDIVVDAAGSEFLSAAHSIPAAGWYLAISLPSEEAFEPIRAIQSGVIGAATIVTLLAGLLIWWTLRREMAPLLTTAKALAAVPESSQFPLALPVARQDEIGRVVNGFNRLLDSLRARDLALRESAARLQEAQSIAGLGSYFLDGATGLWTSSPVLDTLLGIDATYLRNVEGWVSLVHPEEQQKMRDYFAGLTQSQAQGFEATYRVVRPSDGATRWMHGLGRLEYRTSGQFLKMHGTIQDVTETIGVQLRLSTLSRITDQAPIAIVISDVDGNIEYVNPYFEMVTGYAYKDVVGRNPRILQSGKTDPAIYTELWDTVTAGKAWHGEFQNRKKNGDQFVERAVIAPIQNAHGVTTHYVALKEDVTDSKRSQLELQASLREKTALLNEVHHRVKNNLQVIASLLRLEVGRARESATRAVLGEMLGRIRSMALVHEALYRSGTFAAVDLDSYVKQVATAAFRAHAGSGNGVRLVLNLAHVRVSLDQATPCGLLVNELISNCIKHAFPGDQPGEVHVELQPVDPDAVAAEQWCLRVWDDGVGLSADFETRRGRSLGLQLVTDLANQLGGSLDIGQSRGASFSVRFPVAKT